MVLINGILLFNLHILSNSTVMNWARALNSAFLFSISHYIQSQQG